MLIKFIADVCSSIKCSVSFSIFNGMITYHRAIRNEVKLLNDFNCYLSNKTLLPEISMQSQQKTPSYASSVYLEYQITSQIYQLALTVLPLFLCIQRRSHSINVKIKQMDFCSKSYKCI